MQHAQSPTAAFLNDSFPGTFDTNQFVSDDNTEGPRRNSNPVGVTGASATGTSADPQSPTNYLVAFSPVATGAQLPWPAAAVTAASLAPTSSSSPRRLSFSYVPVAMGGTAIGGGMSSMAKPAVAATSSVSPGKRTHDDSEATEPPLTLATPGAMAVSPKRGRANK